jgi:hypothetical protein
MNLILSLCLWLAAFIGALYATVIEAASTPAPAATAPAASALDLTFAALGAYQPLRLRGVDDARSVNVGVRLDRVVTAARLRLRYTYSPALVFELSHLKVSINGEAVASVPFDRGHAGQLVTQEVPLDPRFFTDYNQIGLQLIAHYTVDHCEDPENTALWVDISPTSEVVLDTVPVHLTNDLGLLPAPFFDRRDAQRLVLPFVLPPSVDDATLKSAGVLASWFGALADYRRARFPVLAALPTDSNAIVVGTSVQLPASLDLPSVAGPTLAVLDSPASPSQKVLVVTGRNAAELEQAADALVLGKAAMSGSSVQVARVHIGPPRAPYDAPRWLPIGRPVPFKEIVNDPGQLQVRGSQPDPIRLNLRVPPDIFSWTGQGVPLNLKYRYTAPTVQNDSALAVAINNELVRSFRLPPATADDARGRLQLPLFLGTDVSSTKALDIPAFRVGSDNQLQLSFNLSSQKTGLCEGVAQNPARAAVDPDSTIDFSHFVHYARMPNLAYFANSGFPFTRYADLSHTAIVIPSQPTPEDIEVLLTMLGHMGRWTGVPALRVQIARSVEANGLDKKDILVIGDSGSGVVPSSWQTAAPLTIEPRPAGQVAKTAFQVRESWRGDAKSSQGSAHLDESGSLAAVLGFERPGSLGLSVVALTGTDPQRLQQLLDVFETPGSIAQMQGDVALVRDGRIESMRVGDTYVVSYVPWYAQIWGRAMRHPILLGALGVLAGLLVAMGVFTALRGLAERRRGI